MKREPRDFYPCTREYGARGVRENGRLKCSQTLSLG